MIRPDVPSKTDDDALAEIRHQCAIDRIEWRSAVEELRAVTMSAWVLAFGALLKAGGYHSIAFGCAAAGIFGIIVGPIAVAMSRRKKLRQLSEAQH